MKKRLLTLIARKFGFEKSLMTSFMKYNGKTPIFSYTIANVSLTANDHVVEIMALTSDSVNTFSLGFLLWKCIEGGPDANKAAIEQHRANLKEFGFPIRQDKNV